MASVNKVIIVGNLGRDPELRNQQGNISIATFAVATSRRYKDSQGELQEETEWHRIVVFGRQAEIAVQYLRKGSSVYIEGHLRTRKFTDRDGIERFQTEIVGDSIQFLSTRAQGAEASQSASAPAPAPERRAQPRQANADGQVQRRPAQNRQMAGVSAGAGSLTDEDIPF